MLGPTAAATAASSISWPLVAGLTMVFLLLLFIATLWCCIHRSRKKKRDTLRAEAAAAHNPMFLREAMPPGSQSEIELNSFEMSASHSPSGLSVFSDISSQSFSDSHTELDLSEQTAIQQQQHHLLSELQVELQDRNSEVKTMELELASKLAMVVQYLQAIVLD